MTVMMIIMRILKLMCCFIFLLFSFTNFAQTRTASLVIINAKVHTVDKQKPKAQAIAIKNDKIIAVGTNFEVKKLVDENTKVINVKGKLMLPGFNDSHVHFMGIGNQFSSIDLRNIRNPEEMVEKLKWYSMFLPKGRWILGGQWNHENWTPNNLPTKDLIDLATPNNPVFLYNFNAKIALANSLALEIAGVDQNKNNIADSSIVRDKNGKLTGLLKDAAINFVRAFAPKYPTEDLLAVAETATNYAASLGVTSVQDMHSDYLSETLEKLRRDGKLKTRVYDCTPLLEWKKLVEKGIQRAPGNSMIRSGCLKYFSDGSRKDIQTLSKDIASADRSNLQVVMHAIGKRANDVVLKIYELVAKRNGKRDRRFRIEHAHYMHERDIDRFSKSNTIASMQPHLFLGGESYRTLLDKHVAIAFGSDAPITNFNPLYGIYAAVNRGSSEEIISVEEAVRLYTLGSAYAEFQENIKGSVSVGKLADLIILSDDILTIDPQRIGQVKVLLTMLGGKIVYKYKEFNFE